MQDSVLPRGAIPYARPVNSPSKGEGIKGREGRFGWLGFGRAEGRFAKGASGVCRLCEEVSVGE